MSPETAYNSLTSVPTSMAVSVMTGPADLEAALTRTAGLVRKTAENKAICLEFGIGTTLGSVFAADI